jgi:hypothetical protein
LEKKLMIYSRENYSDINYQRKLEEENESAHVSGGHDPRMASGGVSQGRGRGALDDFGRGGV